MTNADPSPDAERHLQLGSPLAGVGKPEAAALMVGADFAAADAGSAVASFGFENGAGSAGTISVGHNPGTGGFDLLTLSFNGARVWSVDQTGTAFSVSDAAAKVDVRPIDNALAIVNQLRGVSFTACVGADRRRMGLLAQDVEMVLPDMVRTDASGLKAVAYDDLLGVLIEAVKTLSEKVTRLEASSDSGPTP